ncbi:hypothetical protein [Rhizosphaericola mali]|uniref:DUF4177 domain-containing protein n=1 Tax=Rhizosphaericola mali TaxID=2545455 RepID=A0A5P2GCC7_9BACT|nr:hypothetical protein [Rhizosphaericola mali]QES89231.1 hypothetical protein E0W69_011345 [Rhizosphaericola mali]
MKKISAILVLMIVFQSIKAQVIIDDSTLVEQYCELNTHPKALSNKVSIDINFGQFRRFFASPQRLHDEEGRIKNFNSVVDALNYMGFQGWKLVNVVSCSDSSSSGYSYYFKKKFRKDELIENKDID